MKGRRCSRHHRQVHPTDDGRGGPSASAKAASLLENPDDALGVSIPTVMKTCDWKELQNEWWKTAYDLTILHLTIEELASRIESALQELRPSDCERLMRGVAKKVRKAANSGVLSVV